MLCSKVDFADVTKLTDQLNELIKKEITFVNHLNTEFFPVGGGMEVREIQSMRRTQPTVADFEDGRGHRSGNVSSLLNPSIPSQQSARKWRPKPTTAWN